MTDKAAHPSGAPVQTAPPPSSPGPPPEEVFHCRLRNPSQRAHVVFGGALSNVLHHIPPGAAIDAELPESLIERLEDLEHADPEEPGLHVDVLGKVEPPPPPEPRQRRPRPGGTPSQ
jgi:hypothetical protein